MSVAAIKIKRIAAHPVPLRTPGTQIPARYTGLYAAMQNLRLLSILANEMIDCIAPYFEHHRAVGSSLTKNAAPRSHIHRIYLFCPHKSELNLVSASVVEKRLAARGRLWCWRRAGIDGGKFRSVR